MSRIYTCVSPVKPDSLYYRIMSNPILPDIEMASPDEVCKTLVDADRRCYNAVEVTPRIWPPVIGKSGEQHTYRFRDDAEFATLFMVVKNGSINAVYLEHCRVIETSPFTEKALEKLRLSTPVKLENVKSKMHNMRHFTLQGIFVRMEKEEQQRRNVQRCLRVLKTHKDANKTRDDELSRAKREEELENEERQRSNIQRCLHLFEAQQNVPMAQQNVSTAQENDDSPRDSDIRMSLAEYERMEAAEKLRCDAMCADMMG